MFRHFGYFILILGCTVKISHQKVSNFSFSFDIRMRKFIDRKMMNRTFVIRWHDSINFNIHNWDISLEFTFYFQHTEFYLYNFDLYFNKLYINDSEVKESCEVNTKEKPCMFTPSVRYYQTRELKNPWLTVKGVKVETNQTFMDQTFNLCIMDKLPMLNLFMGIFYDLLRTNINFPLRCPFKPVSLIC